MYVICASGYVSILMRNQSFIKMNEREETVSNIIITSIWPKKYLTVARAFSSKWAREPKAATGISETLKLEPIDSFLEKAWI